MTTEIIRAGMEDAAEILALQKLAFQSEAAIYQDFSIPPLIQNLSEIRKEFDAYVFLKAIDASQNIVGSVRARMEGGDCHICRLVVAPTAQRQGLGSRLMQAIEAVFPQAVGYVLETGLKSFSNIAFYGKRGYAVVDEKKISEKVGLVVMYKPGVRSTI